MSKVSLGHSLSSLLSEEIEFRRLVNHDPSKHVILIETDSDTFDQIVIDVPKHKKRSYPEKSSAKNWSSVNIINIDDDENSDDNQSIGIQNVGTSSRVASCQLGNKFYGPSESATDKVQFVKDSSTPVRLSKCKRTYSGNTYVGNLNGSDADSGSISSAFDFCEFVEDSSGKIQPLWRKGLSQTTNADIDRSEIEGNNSVKGQDQFLNNQEKDLESCQPEYEPSSTLFSDSYECTESTGTLNHANDGNNFDEEPREIFQAQCVAEGMPHVSNLQENEHEEDTGSISSDKQSTDVNGDIEKCFEDSLVSKEEWNFREREMIKETDEYRIAMEEEWASRQESLRVQAEEAKQLRIIAKRRKAETARLLDMERRQKERLDEIRNSQKKEEEILNLKEEIRVGVQRELNELESKCKKNMASILHELGISVEGWPAPSPQQILISYKKALLAFHPDRASRLEIQQQVEAEEKFKLIVRLKDDVLQK